MQSKLFLETEMYFLRSWVNILIVIKSGDPEQSKQCNPSKHNSYERYNNKLTEVAKPQNVRVNMYRLLKYRRHVGLSCMGGLCGHDSQLATHAMVLN